MGRGRSVEIDATAETGKPPEEAGGDGSASLFDASGDARVRVMRRDDSTQKMVTHGYMPPTVTEEDVSKAFGGGNYRAQLVIPDPASGLAKVKSSRDFFIPGKYRPPVKISTFEEAGPNGDASNPAAAAAAVGTLPIPGVAPGDDLMQLLKAGLVQTILDLMDKKNQAPQSDPMLLKLIEQTSATQQKMMEFMLTLATRDNGGADRKAIMAELLQFKELFGGGAATPADPLGMFNKMLDTFKSFKDAAEEVAPQPADTDPILGSIPKLVEVVAEQHQMNKAAQAARVPARVPMPHVPPVAGQPEVGTVQPENVPMWKLILRQQGARMVAQASTKADPDVIAGAAILFAPPAVKEALIGFFKRDENEVMADILAEIPAMAEHREWLAEFVDAAQQRLFPELFIDDGEETETEKAE